MNFKVLITFFPLKNIRNLLESAIFSVKTFERLFVYFFFKIPFTDFQDKIT